MTSASGFYRYAQLIANNTNYAKRMQRLSDRIFGEIVNKNSYGKSMKVARMLAEKPLETRPEFISYYPKHPQIHSLMMQLREFGLYRDEHRDFQEEMMRLRRLRGKVKTKPGQGKRKNKDSSTES